MKGLSEPLLKEIEGYINDHQPEFFWDYRDSLSNDQIARLATGNADALGEIEEGILSHNQGDGHRLIREAEKDVRHRFKPRLKAELGKGWKKAFKHWISGAGLICVSFCCCFILRFLIVTSQATRVGAAFSFTYTTTHLLHL